MSRFPIRTQHPTSFADQSGHALIDIQLRSRGLQKVSLIADPQHFPAEDVSRIASMASQFIQAHLEEVSSLEESPWEVAAPKAANLEPNRGQLAPAPAHHRQRLLISLIKRSERVLVEPAFSSIDPKRLSAEAIDELISRLDDFLNSPPHPSRLFVSGQN